MYPMYGIVNMTLAVRFSLFTVHWSGSSFASSFVMNPPSVTLIILWVIDVDCESMKRARERSWWTFALLAKERF